MRLVEYLFGDPGGPPQPDHGSNAHMSPVGAGFADYVRVVHPHTPLADTMLAPLDGQPIPHLAHGYTPETAMRYRHYFGFTESLDESQLRWKRTNIGRYSADAGGGRSFEVVSISTTTEGASKERGWHLLYHDPKHGGDPYVNTFGDARAAKKAAQEDLDDMASESLDEAVMHYSQKMGGKPCCGNRQSHTSSNDKAQTECVKCKAVLKKWADKKAKASESIDEAKQYKIKDKAGNSLPVEVEHDTEKGDYVAVVRGGRHRRMASGNERQPIRDHATGATPEAAVKALAKKLRESISGPSVQTFSELLGEGALEQRATRGAWHKLLTGLGFAVTRTHLIDPDESPEYMYEYTSATGELTIQIQDTEKPGREFLWINMRKGGSIKYGLTTLRKFLQVKRVRAWYETPTIESIDEVLKKGVQSNSAGDNGAISKLEKGTYPARAEDGMGFCFQWADGRGICAFRLRADALRWAKEQPRDIVKFWYGEPVHSNGKFRIRVMDRYRKGKEESVETFSELLGRRSRAS